jgi:hypothetical protein
VRSGAGPTPQKMMSRVVRTSSWMLDVVEASGVGRRNRPLSLIGLAGLHTPQTFRVPAERSREGQARKDEAIGSGRERKDDALGRRRMRVGRGGETGGRGYKRGGGSRYHRIRKLGGMADGGIESDGATAQDPDPREHFGSNGEGKGGGGHWLSLGPGLRPVGPCRPRQLEPGTFASLTLATNPNRRNSRAYRTACKGRPCMAYSDGMNTVLPLLE